MKNLNYTLCGILLPVLLGACGISNDVSFAMTPGQCADGTSNAPYCMAVKIQNNAGGQNWINSSNVALQSLEISVTGASNLNYPVTQGSTLDPNGCINSTVKPGGGCTFYVQLTGESVAVGQSSPITINANYKLDDSLFGGGTSSASASVDLYQKPNLVISNVSGRIINYSKTGLQSQFSGESGGSVAVNANSNDNYYGFLYLATNNGIFLSGNESFAYNKAESLVNINNYVVNGTTAYPISGNNIYSSSIKPIGSIAWSNFATAANVKSNTAMSALGKIIVASTNNVFNCSSSSSTGGCAQEGVALSGTINKLSYTTLGSSNSGTLLGTNLTGLVVGTVNGLFVESGTFGSSANAWLPVYEENNPIVSNIVSMVEDSSNSIFISDTTGNIFKLNFNGGNTASLQAMLPTSSSGVIVAMSYDNAGKVLYVITDLGNLYGCTDNGTTLSCDNAVASNVFTGAAFGLNIITSLYSGSI
jgi:hypothetical protein